MKKIVIRVIIGALFLSFSCKGEKTGEIRVGGIFDLTGPTSETGSMFANGVKGYIDYINEKGGINGRKVRLISIDTAYILARDLAAYDRLVNGEKVHLIIGWSTGSTEKLAPRLAEDRIPFTSVSYSRKLADVERAPYNFIMGPTYSDQMKIALKYIKDNWKVPARNPRVAFLYNDKEYGRSPISDGRAYAQKTGVDLVAEEIVFLDAREAREQILKLREKKPDYVIINNTAWPTYVVLRDAKMLGLDAKFIGLIWSSDEKIITLAGRDAEGFIGTTPFVAMDPRLPGVREIIDFNRRRNGRSDSVMFLYANGWTTAKVMLEGARRAGDDLSGERIRKELEGLSSFSTGGITDVYSFSENNHVGLRRLRLCQVTAGKWRPITDFVGAE
ncbi:MAG TPA: ABC transporter substrate-binding protein [Spirochaetota bacterium]|nr:ABC transporter substrate-binding protein [Spirochaetota bacterium]HPC43160.1 ABC transporter substrate-binding protein [Spirochaetota bacterium]HQF10060.1 ABC transporter substrate-binding protein [Spirochaetota bacterium]HQH98799.1 ABC transporter substrate-binding protein [Spirochaetota bacterium]HQJ70450.1 ABC transporter substrate-binding protein [Spirochaetota bacterium]